MVCIRIFNTEKEALLAKNILQEGGISAIVTEDKFNNIPIQQFGVPARFRLKIANKDLDRAGGYLAAKLQNRVGSV